MYLLLLLTLVQSGACWVDMGSHLTGRIIHIESVKNPGYWLEAHSGKWYGAVRGSSEETVYIKSWSQFLVKQCDSETVCLESILLRDHYVSALYSWWVYLPKIFHPDDKPKAQWNIRCESIAMERCWFHSKRKDYQDLYLTAEDANDWVEVQQGNENGIPDKMLFRILAPNPSERYVVVKKLTNRGSTNIDYSVKYKYGIEHSTKISHTFKIGANLGFEIKSAFMGGLSLSYEWKKETTDTFRQSTEQTLTITVPPFSIYTVKVLVGEYGPFLVKSKSVKIECLDLKTNYNCMPNYQLIKTSYKK